MPQQEPPPTSGVRYVEVSPPAGWQTMAKTVRGFDEDKVQNCKEDIDTLLVFTGLYSAVLSAFVVESYTDLRPDPNTQIVFLLERIVVQTQSYTITSGTLDSAAQPSPILPHFTVPLWAVRVNGLWFASLIISLATASLSMLVKQWLREYLAIEHTAPQERLRARQYRRPGLEKWKVFEIAAVLPMLIQLSLGLFFAGLCFFTANVDEHVYFTSVPLVSGWAFFIVVTTLAPLVSPRCPYKIPLLKSVVRAVRTRVVMRIRRSFASLPAGRPEAGIDDEEDQVITGDKDDKDMLLSMDAIMADDSLLPTMWNAFKQRSDPRDSLDFIVELIVSRAGSDAVYLRSPRLRRIPNLTPLSRQAWATFMEMLADLAGRCQPGPLLASSPGWLYKTTLLLLSTSHYPLPNPALACLRSLLVDASGSFTSGGFVRWITPQPELPDEQEFDFRPFFDRLCLASEQDTQGNILFYIASLMANDSQLPAVLELLKRHSHDISKSLSFIVHLIATRLGGDAEYLLPVRLRAIPDFTLLSLGAWNTFMEMLADLADRRKPRGPLLESSPDWLHKTTLLLLSSSPHSLPPSAVTCLRHLLAHNKESPDLAAYSIAQWIIPRLDEKSFVFRPLTDRLRLVYENDGQESGSILAVYCMYAELLRPYRSNSPSTEPQPLYVVLSQEPDLFQHRMARPILEDIWDLIHFALLWQSKSEDPSSLIGFKESVHIFWELSDLIGRRGYATANLAAFWGDPRYAYIALSLTFSSLHHLTHAPRAYMLQFCMDAFTSSHANDQTAMLDNSMMVAQQYVNGMYDDGQESRPIDIVRFCYLHIRLCVGHAKEDPETQTSSSSSSSSSLLSIERMVSRSTTRTLCNAINAALRKYTSEKRWRVESAQYYTCAPASLTPDELLAEDRKLAMECLDIVESVENGGGTSTPCSSTREPIFPDELVVSLGSFVPPEYVTRYSRLARLQERRRLASQQPEVGPVGPSYVTAGPSALRFVGVTDHPLASQSAVQSVQHMPSQERQYQRLLIGGSSSFGRDAEELPVNAGAAGKHGDAEEGPMNRRQQIDSQDTAGSKRVHFDVPTSEEDDHIEGYANEGDDATEDDAAEDSAQVDEGGIDTRVALTS